MRKKSTKYINKNIATATTVVVLYVIIDLIRYFNIVTQLTGNVLYILIGSFSILYSITKKGIDRQKSIVIFVLFYTLFGLIGILANGNINPQELLWPFAFIGIAMILLNFKTYFNAIKYLYFSSISMIAIKILTVGTVNELSTLSSRNAVGIMVLIYFSFLVISAHTNKRRIGIFPVILGLFVVILAIGRSGILTFVILAMFFMIFKFDGDIHKMRKPSTWIIVIAYTAIVLLLINNLANDYFGQALDNFQSRGLESTRSIIWTDYWAKTSKSFFFILFGAPVSGTFFLDLVQGNLHNAFLMLHSKYGLMQLIIIIYMLIKSGICYFKEKNYLYLTLLIAVLFRMQFDHTNFNAQLDIVFFYLIFYRYYKTYNFYERKGMYE